MKKKKLKERQLKEEIVRQFSSDKIEKMKLIAQRISQKLGQKTTPSTSESTDARAGKSSPSKESKDLNDNTTRVNASGKYETLDSRCADV